MFGGFRDVEVPPRGAACADRCRQEVEDTGAPPWTCLSIGIEAPSTGHRLSLGHTEEVRTVTKPTRWPEPRQFLVGLHGALLNRRSPWPTPVATPSPVRNPFVELAMNRRVFLPCSVGEGHCRAWGFIPTGGPRRHGAWCSPRGVYGCCEEDAPSIVGSSSDDRD
jgi:hypothetical protein